MGSPSSDDKISRLFTPALYERKKKNWNGQVQNKLTLCKKNNGVVGFPKDRKIIQ